MWRWAHTPDASDLDDWQVARDSAGLQGDIPWMDDTLRGGVDWHPSEHNNLAVAYVHNFCGFNQVDLVQTEAAKMLDEGHVTQAELDAAGVPTCTHMSKKWWADQGITPPIILKGTTLSGPKVRVAAPRSKSRDHGGTQDGPSGASGSGRRRHSRERRHSNSNDSRIRPGHGPTRDKSPAPGRDRALPRRTSAFPTIDAASGSLGGATRGDVSRPASSAPPHVQGPTPTGGLAAVALPPPPRHRGQDPDTRPNSYAGRPQGAPMCKVIEGTPRDPMCGYGFGGLSLIHI